MATIMELGEPIKPEPMSPNTGSIDDELYHSQAEESFAAAAAVGVVNDNNNNSTEEVGGFSIPLSTPASTSTAPSTSGSSPSTSSDHSSSASASASSNSTASPQPSTSGNLTLVDDSQASAAGDQPLTEDEQPPPAPVDTEEADHTNQEDQMMHITESDHRHQAVPSIDDETLMPPPQLPVVNSPPSPTITVVVPNFTDDESPPEAEQQSGTTGGPSVVSSVAAGTSTDYLANFQAVCTAEKGTFKDLFTTQVDNIFNQAISLVTSLLCQPNLPPPGQIAEDINRLIGGGGNSTNAEAIVQQIMAAKEQQATAVGQSNHQSTASSASGGRSCGQCTSTNRCACYHEGAASVVLCNRCEAVLQEEELTNGLDEDALRVVQAEEGADYNGGESDEERAVVAALSRQHLEAPNTSTASSNATAHTTDHPIKVEILDADDLMSSLVVSEVDESMYSEVEGGFGTQSEAENSATPRQYSYQLVTDRPGLVSKITVSRGRRAEEEASSSGHHQENGQGHGHHGRQIGGDEEENAEEGTVQMDEPVYDVNNITADTACECEECQEADAEIDAQDAAAAASRQKQAAENGSQVMTAPSSAPNEQSQMDAAGSATAAGPSTSTPALSAALASGTRVFIPITTEVNMQTPKTRFAIQSHMSGIYTLKPVADGQQTSGANVITTNGQAYVPVQLANGDLMITSTPSNSQASTSSAATPPGQRSSMVRVTPRPTPSVASQAAAASTTTTNGGYPPVHQPGRQHQHPSAGPNRAAICRKTGRPPFAATTANRGQQQVNGAQMPLHQRVRSPAPPVISRNGIAPSPLSPSPVSGITTRRMAAKTNTTTGPTRMGRSVTPTGRQPLQQAVTRQQHQAQVQQQHMRSASAETAPTARRASLPPGTTVLGSAPGGPGRAQICKRTGLPPKNQPLGLAPSASTATATVPNGGPLRRSGSTATLPKAPATGRESQNRHFTHETAAAQQAAMSTAKRAAAAAVAASSRTISSRPSTASTSAHTEQQQQAAVSEAPVAIKTEPITTEIALAPTTTRVTITGATGTRARVQQQQQQQEPVGSHSSASSSTELASSVRRSNRVNLNPAQKRPLETVPEAEATATTTDVTAEQQQISSGPSATKRRFGGRSVVPVAQQEAPTAVAAARRRSAESAPTPVQQQPVQQRRVSMNPAIDVSMTSASNSSATNQQEVVAAEGNVAESQQQEPQQQQEAEAVAAPAEGAPAAAEAVPAVPATTPPAPKPRHGGGRLSHLKDPAKGEMAVHDLYFDCPVEGCPVGQITIKEKLQEHLWVTHTIGPYKCSWGCKGVSFFTKREYDAHRKEQHVDSGFQCPDCDRAENGWNSLYIHMRRNHEPGRFTCNWRQCGDVYFSTREQVYQHFKKAHKTTKSAKKTFADSYKTRRSKKRTAGKRTRPLDAALANAAGTVPVEMVPQPQQPAPEPQAPAQPEVQQSAASSAPREAAVAVVAANNAGEPDNNELDVQIAQRIAEQARQQALEGAIGGSRTRRQSPRRPSVQAEAAVQPIVAAGRAPPASRHQAAAVAAAQEARYPSRNSQHHHQVGANRAAHGAAAAAAGRFGVETRHRIKREPVDHEVIRLRHGVQQAIPARQVHHHGGRGGGVPTRGPVHPGHHHHHHGHHHGNRPQQQHHHQQQVRVIGSRQQQQLGQLHHPRTPAHRASTGHRDPIQPPPNRYPPPIEPPPRYGPPYWRCTYGDCISTSQNLSNLKIHIRTVHFGLPRTKQEQHQRNIIDNREAKIYCHKVDA